ncbi:MAG TPA: hypothetical protein DEQ61_23215 [Streptomyces sp.]|nr:hypothetical protein [Streptomyces sp.]
MTVTVATVLGHPGQHSNLLAGAENTGNPVRWVHVCELPDPTPFLMGGETLLSTGMRLPGRGRLLRTYVDRPADASGAGLGFGVGFSHEAVPEGLVVNTKTKLIKRQLYGQSGFALLRHRM